MKDERFNGRSPGAAEATRRYEQQYEESDAMFDRVLAAGSPDTDRLDALWQRLQQNRTVGARRVRGGVGAFVAVLLAGGASFAGWQAIRREPPITPGQGQKTQVGWNPSGAPGPSSVEPESAPPPVYRAVGPGSRQAGAPNARFKPRRSPPPSEGAVSDRPAPNPKAVSVARASVVGRTVDGETARLASALSRLRRDRDAAGALIELDDYLRSFPNGTLVTEARFARVDALLMLDLREEALSALSRLELDTNLRGLQLRLVRAELRAERRCEVALGDFSVVIDAEPSAVVRERALRGRAACYLQLGAADAARRDFTEYLRRFPGGRFADEARAQLRP